MGLAHRHLQDMEFDHQTKFDTSALCYGWQFQTYGFDPLDYAALVTPSCVIGGGTQAFPHL